MNLLLTEYLKSNNLIQASINNKLIFFSNNSSNIPLLFFSIFFKTIRLLNHEVNYININNTDFNDLISKLEMSFLGQNIFFWLGDVSSLNEINKKKLLNYLFTYNGPHTIFLFVNNNDLKNKNNVIICPDFIDLDIVKSLLQFFKIKNEQLVLQNFQKIIKKNNKISLEQASILIYYIVLLGNKIDLFLDIWANKIVNIEQSLFALSKSFFAKNYKDFFISWNNISLDYSAVFWTSFWSDQLFRASNFIYFISQNKINEAKQISYRLPFSFIQYDWKKFSFNELQNAHYYIYDLDSALKNNRSEIALDLFYAKYFQNHFV